MLFGMARPAQRDEVPEVVIALVAIDVMDVQFRIHLTQKAAVVLPLQNLLALRPESTFVGRGVVATKIIVIVGADEIGRVTISIAEHSMSARRDCQLTWRNVDRLAAMFAGNVRSFL